MPVIFYARRPSVKRKIGFDEPARRFSEASGKRASSRGLQTQPGRPPRFSFR
jgi:hypothetical protein